MRKISVVTPTLSRPNEVAELLDNLNTQTLLPYELVLIDGALEQEKKTEKVIGEKSKSLRFQCRYIRHKGGTAIQRNVGIDSAGGDFIAFIDDDIRLEPDFFEKIMAVFRKDTAKKVKGVCGYIVNQYLDPKKSLRWRWYRRLRLFTTYEPGRYDFQAGYPINRYLQPPHDGLREIDFMGAGCAVWRKEVFARGLRFDGFFTGYGILEDAHFALRAGRFGKLLECGRARCFHLRLSLNRIAKRQIAYKTAVNYRYVFLDIVRQRTWRQEIYFWRVQAFGLLQLFSYALRFCNKENWLAVVGKIEGIIAAFFMNESE